MLMRMPESGGMTVELARDVENFLQQRVRDGVCGDPSELVDDVVRSLREQQSKPFKVTPELEAWLLESADQASTPLTRSDFNSIRKRARARNGRRTS
jgi:Arc/MetJ-type ribon-helix-helix transcriptional regulator